MTHYFERLQSQITAHWDKNALCDYGGECYTFGNLATQIAKMHLLFKALGIKKGDRIAICAKNQARWGITFLSINTYEAVVVPLLADFHPDNISSIVDHSESVALFADPEIWNKLDLSRMPQLKYAISVNDFSLLWGRDEDRSAFDSLEERFIQAYPNGFTAEDLHLPTGNDKDLAVINYTSGSTGDPKGVMLRYECFSANVEYSHKRIPSYPEDNLLSILPLAHMFGMVIELIYPLCGGSTVYFLGKAPSPTLLLKAMRDVRPYLVIAVPMVFEKIYRSKLKPMMEKKSVRFLMSVPGFRHIIYNRMRKGLDDAFGGRVRMYIMGGAAVNADVEAFLHKIGFHFTVGYGMTEAAPLLTYEDWDKFVLRSCGKAIDCVQLRIDSEDPRRIDGEIQAKGVNIMSGYFKNEKATKAAFTADGWFNTGDLGIIDSKGNVFIKGRSKSMLLSSNGQNIYPEEIESVINSQPCVIESLVVQRDFKLIALVYFDKDALKKEKRVLEALKDEIIQATNARMPKYSQLCGIEVVEDPFQKTPKASIKRFLYR